LKNCAFSFRFGCGRKRHGGYKRAAELFESNLEPILGVAYGVALHLTHNAADAEDLVQEAAVKSFCGFHNFQAGTNFRRGFCEY
jgi:DNA-directed RNA polymerase specialized sigma24 family protein